MPCFELAYSGEAEGFVAEIRLFVSDIRNPMMQYRIDGVERVAAGVYRGCISEGNLDLGVPGRSQALGRSAVVGGPSRGGSGFVS